MNFQFYLDMIDNAIAELQEIRNALALAQGEVAAGKCPFNSRPTNPPPTDDCDIALTTMDLGPLELDFRTRLLNLGNRFVDILPETGENA